jgi:hypothetical protein
MISEAGKIRFFQRFLTQNNPNTVADTVKKSDCRFPRLMICDASSLGREEVGRGITPRFSARVKLVEEAALQPRNGPDHGTVGREVYRRR